MLKNSILIVMISGLTACGDGPDQNAAASSQLNSGQDLVVLAPLKASQFDDAADPGCLRGVEARFQAKTDGVLTKVGLENTVSGPCEILMPKEARAFQLIRQPDQCGSKIYRSTDSDGRTVIISDHSERICEDFRPFLIEIRETDEFSRTKTYGGGWN